MALIKCTDCGRDISDRAPSCIHCGSPLAESLGSGTALVTTQATSKNIKKALIGFGCLTIVSCANVWTGVRVKDSTDASLWAGLFWVGVIGFGVTKLRAWWHHG